MGLFISFYKGAAFMMLAVIGTGLLNAQERKVCGEVVAFEEIGLKGVFMTSQKSQDTAFTNSKGGFCILCEEKDQLIIKAKGFYDKKIRLKNIDDSLKISLKFKEGKKNYQIATGLGYISKNDMTYAVSNLRSSNNDFGKYSDIFNLIQGELTGVDVQGEKIYIRGTTSFDSTPLFVVDGVPREDISDIHPLEVKSVSVLKDGAASIYGLRGGNGVIVIERKKR